MELLIFKISSVILAILLGWITTKYIIVKDEAKFWESMYRDSDKTNKELMNVSEETLKLNDELLAKLAQKTPTSKDQR